MTRTEFNSRFQATQHNTSGFTAAQLAAINDRTFAMVSVLELDDLHTKSAVDHAFAAQFARE